VLDLAAMSAIYRESWVRPLAGYALQETRIGYVNVNGNRTHYLSLSRVLIDFFDQDLSPIGLLYPCYDT